MNLAGALEGNYTLLGNQARGAQELVQHLVGAVAPTQKHPSARLFYMTGRLPFNSPI